jgi:hypothetical protein
MNTEMTVEEALIKAERSSSVAAAALEVPNLTLAARDGLADLLEETALLLGDVRATLHPIILNLTVLQAA